MEKKILTRGTFWNWENIEKSHYEKNQFLLQEIVLNMHGPILYT